MSARYLVLPIVLLLSIGFGLAQATSAETPSLALHGAFSKTIDTPFSFVVAVENPQGSASQLMVQDFLYEPGPAFNDFGFSLRVRNAHGVVTQTLPPLKLIGADNRFRFSTGVVLLEGDRLEVRGDSSGGGRLFLAGQRFH